MSGEAGGAIIGGVLLISALPVVITGAAAIGLGYATLKIVGSLGKYAAETAQQKKYEKQLAVDQCSVELGSLYHQLKLVSESQTIAQNSFIEKMQKSFSAMQSDLEALQLQKPHTEVMQRKVIDTRTKIHTELVDSVRTFKREVLDINSEKITQSIDSFTRKMNATMQAINKTQQDKKVLEQKQRQLAENYLRDAQASLTVLRRMQDSSDEYFREQLATMENTYISAENNLSVGAYQASISSAMTVITNSALIASRHIQEQQEADFQRATLIAQLEGLKKEMEHRRVIEFNDPTRPEGKQTIVADLDKFSQGKYSRMLFELEQKIEMLSNQSSQNLSVYEIRKLCDQFENITEPEARIIIDRSIRVMGGYYERVDSLNVISEFMNEQGYSMSWVMPEGGDASQKIVVEFHQASTGNDICVTLDYDPSSSDLAKMAMEVLTYYDSAHIITEIEKKEMRTALVQALSQAGLSSNLACQSFADQSAPQNSHPTKQSVKNQKPKTRI